MGDQRGVAETLDLLGVAAFLGGNRATARTLVTRAILVCRASNIRRLLAANLAVMAELSGSDRLSLVEVSEGADIPDPMRLAQEAVEVARDIGWSAGESYSLAILALVLATQGYFGRALPTAQHGLMIAEEIGHQQWSAKAHKTLAVVCFELYALPVAQRHLEQAIALARGVRASPMREMAASLLAAVHLLQGDLPQVEAVLSEHFREDRHPMLLNDRLARKVRAELALARGDPASALAIVDQLVKEVIGDDPTITVPSLLLTRAEALLALGQWEAAAGVLATAVRGAEARGMRPLLWRLHVLIARLHQATGRMEEAKRALAIARTIIDQITENLPDEPVAELGGHSLGANFRAMISDQIPGLLPRTPRQSAKHAYGGLTDREREIARLIANGNSNREISGALFISERTVSTHVTNILAKLEFTSRAQIASWVSETGLADPNVNVDRR
jgi:DNA-binding CsgD family transcriptional regulator